MTQVRSVTGSTVDDPLRRFRQKGFRVWGSGECRAARRGRTRIEDRLQRMGKRIQMRVYAEQFAWLPEEGREQAPGVRPSL